MLLLNVFLDAEIRKEDQTYQKNCQSLTNTMVKGRRWPDGGLWIVGSSSGGVIVGVIGGGVLVVQWFFVVDENGGGGK